MDKKETIKLIKEISKQGKIWIAQEGILKEELIDSKSKHLGYDKLQ